MEAWNALAQALIGAGLEIHTAWPIHTESESSLHIAKKNAARSTILLVCRKRSGDGKPVWWDDEFQERLERVVRQKAEEFEAHGITGVDLYLSTFGPVLREVSQNWPVMDPQGGEPITPDQALDLARRVVGDYRIEKLAAAWQGEIDPVTRWYLLAWDLFRAAEFPFDEGRKLALVAGGEVVTEKSRGRGKKTPDFLDVLKDRLVVVKKGEYLQIQSPAERFKKNKVDPAAAAYPVTLDALHAALVLLKEDGLRGVEGLFRRTNVHRDAAFLSAFEALHRALPRIREEWKGLEALRAEFLADRIAPLPEEEDALEAGLFDGEDGGDEEFEEDED